MTRATKRCAAVGLLVILVSTPLATAAVPVQERAQDRAECRALPLEAMLISLWSTLAHFWEKEGSSVDPSGKPEGSSQSTPQGIMGDEGSSLDPDGVQ